MISGKCQWLNARLGLVLETFMLGYLLLMKSLIQIEFMLSQRAWLHRWVYIQIGLEIFLQ